MRDIYIYCRNSLKNWALLEVWNEQNSKEWSVLEKTLDIEHDMFLNMYSYWCDSYETDVYKSCSSKYILW